MQDAGCRMHDAGYRIQDLKGQRHSLFIPDFSENKRLAEKITKMAIKIDGLVRTFAFFAPLLIILSDDADKKGKTFYAGLKSRYRSLKQLDIKQGEDLKLGSVPRGRELIVAVFSSIRAWKGGASPWLLKCITELKDKVEIFISFGNPYLIDNIRDRIGDCPRFTDRAERRRRIGTVPASISMPTGILRQRRRQQQKLS